CGPKPAGHYRATPKNLHTVWVKSRRLISADYNGLTMPKVKVQKQPAKADLPKSCSFAGTAMLGALLLGVVTLLAYLPALRGGFILDDNGYLTNAALIKAPDGLVRFWFTFEAMDYYPVSNSTLWLEWRLWGMDPTGYHVTNLVLHIAAALLIWAIVRK